LADNNFSITPTLKLPIFGRCNAHQNNRLFSRTADHRQFPAPGDQDLPDQAGRGLQPAVHAVIHPGADILAGLWYNHPRVADHPGQQRHFGAEFHPAGDEDEV